MALETGALLDGKYRILHEVGRGGMSIVYMAINEKANKTWAVKEVRKDGVLDFEAVRQGLIVETEMLKRLRHPNLPSIIDIIEDEDTLIIVMDYIEGVPLSKVLSEYGAQPQEYVIEWGKQLCDVLSYLHSQDPPIIYRDMKPSNVMLKPDGNLALIDFGTAREFKEKKIEDTTCLGTIGYAAPEQFGGMGQTDARTDIYCLGATLYHLVTGMNPGKPPYEMKPIRTVNPRLSSGLEKILLKCTQRDPEDRYQQCFDLRYALEHYEKIDDRYRKKQKGRLRLFVLALIASLGLLLAGIWMGQSSLKLAGDYYEQQLAEAERSTDYEKKLELYEQCIDIPDKGGKTDAYLGMIQLFKEGDARFTVGEASLLDRKIKEHSKELKKDPSAYSDLCFEVGKLYWYYYDYGSETGDNQIVRMKSAIDWFDDAARYAPEKTDKTTMATVYAAIGTFYRDIASKAIEGADKGLYKPFFEQVKQLLETVASNEHESEIVRLELLELSQSALQQYASRLYADGVSKDAMLQLCDLIDQISGGLVTTTQKTGEIKSGIRNRLEETRDAIQAVFVGEEGGD
ncbi:MAG: serine/threonine-protein kinase [Saccharofermentanales bacterium]